MASIARTTVKNQQWAQNGGHFRVICRASKPSGGG
jgi:hypothetical protein